MHRNDPCHCGTGRKYKKCCLGKDENEVRDMILDGRKPCGPTEEEPKANGAPMNLKIIPDLLLFAAASGVKL